MIRVLIKSKEIIVAGHADFDDYGRDIVCASVSAIVTTTVNAILRFDKESIRYEVKDGLVKISILKDNESANKLLDNMISLVIELSRDYPKNIKVERE